jgi:hypothetical protein
LPYDLLFFSSRRPWQQSKTRQRQDKVRDKILQVKRWQGKARPDKQGKTRRAEGRQGKTDNKARQDTRLFKKMAKTKAGKPTFATVSPSSVAT